MTVNSNDVAKDKNGGEDLRHRCPGTWTEALVVAILMIN